MSSQKFFPIKTETACQLKWNWSTIHLYKGKTSSCCRTGSGPFSVENFDDFHNTDVKIKDRQDMLAGLWPDSGCDYCAKVEAVGGFSERNRHANIPDLVPAELDHDPTAVKVTPAILEVYFDYTCNLGCLYCSPEISSTINQENIKFGLFDQNGVRLDSVSIYPEYQQALDKFWQWMGKNSHKLKRFSVLGGEPFYQRQFENCIEYFETHPHPELEFGLVTNLTLDPKRLDQWLDRFKNLLAQRKLKRIDITCSIDTWGTEQEFVRWGLDLETWERNFEKLLKHKWLTININQCISVLTIKNMPALIEKLNKWRQQHIIGHWFGMVEPEPTWLRPDVLGSGIFDQDFESVLKLMPQDSDVERDVWQQMNSVAEFVKQSKRNNIELLKLKTFLDEKDRRRGTNWRQQFPWLEKELIHVV